MKYYISDTHFHHRNILDFEERPFNSVDEMNESLIKKWNNKIKAGDCVYILGDLIFARTQEDFLSIVPRLNGQLFLIKGNHDSFLKIKDVEGYFIWIKQYAQVMDNGQKLALFHYPIEDWNGRHKGSIHLHGHIHSRTCQVSVITNRYNVCADINNYEPCTLQEVIHNNKLFNERRKIEANNPSVRLTY